MGLRSLMTEMLKPAPVADLAQFYWIQPIGLLVEVMNAVLGTDMERVYPKL